MKIKKKKKIEIINYEIKKKGLCFCKSLDEELLESDSSCFIIGFLIIIVVEYFLYI